MTPARSILPLVLAFSLVIFMVYPDRAANAGEEVADILVGVADQDGFPLKEDFPVRFFDKQGNQIAEKIGHADDSSSGFRWWTSNRAQFAQDSFMTLADARRVATAVIEAKGCAPYRLQISLKKVHHPASRSFFHGGGSFTEYKFSKGITLQCTQSDAEKAEVANVHFQALLFRNLAGAIITAVNAGTFDEADLEKLDATWPNEAGFGDNRRYEIFNLAGPFMINPERLIADLPPGSRALVTKDLPLHFVLYRSKGQDDIGGRLKLMDMDYLMGVVPGVSKKICSRAWDVLQTDGPPPMPPLAQGAVVPGPALAPLLSEADEFYCVKDKTGTYYRFDEIAARRLDKEKKRLPVAPQ